MFSRDAVRRSGLHPFNRQRDLWQRQHVGHPGLGGNYTARYAYTNLGQLSNLSQVSSSPTCSSKGTIDYTGSYDAWGNVSSQQRGSTTKSTAYDAQDHLLHWSSSVSNQQEWYLYDASGERVLRRSFDGTNTTLTVYAFGLEEHQYAYSGSGSTATNTGNTYYYTLAGRLLGTWDGSSPTTTFLLTDSLGSVVSSFNNPSSGAVMQGNQLYGPYGNQRLKQGSLSTNKGFTGQYNDGLTGLDYYNARYYDPTIGVFLSADTVQGNSQGMDPYSYVGGNPETRTDPTGTRMIAPDGSLGWVNPFTNDLTTYILPPAHSGYTAQLQTRPHTTQAPYDPMKDKANSPQAKLGRETGISTLLNPKASAADKLKALWHGVSNLFIAAGFFMGGPEADAGVAATDGVIEGGDGLIGGIEDALSTCGGGLSFTPSTKVATAHGEQAIGTVHPGDKVWAYNPKTHTMELQPILHVWINHDNDLIDLTITTTHPSHGKVSKTTHEVIHTNKKHPFLTLEKGFLPVGQIKLGMHVVEADRQLGVITGWKVVPGVKTMYNLEVAQDHTFAVGAGQWVVHNCDPSSLVNSDASRIAQRLTNAFNDHLTPEDLSGAWRDLHGNPVPRAGGGFFNHIGEVEDALQSGRNAINSFKRLLGSGTLSEADSCVVQCLIGRTSKVMDYVEKVITRDQWYPGTDILPFP